ncbi:hypothetical protein C9J85_18695 [Haloferax sp. wsp5]|nr:hypothetical protein C9J85_18695 [Haloferax sp. wsp5]
MSLSPQQSRLAGEPGNLLGSEQTAAAQEPTAEARADGVAPPSAFIHYTLIKESKHCIILFSIDRRVVRSNTQLRTSVTQWFISAD